MRVYLVRHGDANPKAVDPNRGLSAKGLRDVQKMAAFLKPLGLRAGVVWHSGKARAAQTAQIMATAVASDAGVVQREGLAPNDPTKLLRKALAQADDDLMIVGHLPFLGKLASALVAGDEAAGVVDFPAGAAVCVERHGEATWAVVWMLIPDVLP